MKIKRLGINEAGDIKKFPNFHKSGSVKGMKDKYYGKDAMIVRCGSWIYNVDKETYDRAH